MSLLDKQIAELDATAIEYCTDLSHPKFSNDTMRDYWLGVAQGWLMVLGLRKAQLISLRRLNGLVLVA